MILGFDPGREKCGIAVMERTPQSSQNPNIAYAEVVTAEAAIGTVHSLLNQYPITMIVMGNQTMSQAWKSNIEQSLAKQRSHDSIGAHHQPRTINERTITPIVLVDERYSTLEARDRYWTLHPPKGLQKIIPQSLRSIPRPIDDVVAIILIERYWKSLDLQSETLSVSSVP